MKNILIIFFIASVLNAQALELIYDGVTPKWAIDLDGSTEYAYKNTPTGLDLNGSEMITATADRDFSGAGHWVGMTVSGGVGTFTTTASLATDYYTDMVVGHNYTIQGDFKSGASSSFKIVTDNDSTTITTTTTSATKAFTFTYSGGSQTVQFKGVGTDTWTADNISIKENYKFEIETWFKGNSTANSTIFEFTPRLQFRLNATTGKPQMYWTGSSTFGKEGTGTYNNNVWYKLNITFDIINAVCSTYVYIDGALNSQMGYEHSAWKQSFTKLNVGSRGDGTEKWLGQIGEIKFTRKDGTGAVVSTSKYDWKGTSATFLNDKGTNGNHLTGVNVTTADQVKFSGGKYK